MLGMRQTETFSRWLDGLADVRARARVQVRIERLAGGNAGDVKPEGGHMGKTVTTRYDVAEHLRSPEEMAAYLEACLEEAGDDAAFIAKVLGDIARARGMAQVARDAGLSRESLYKALSGERSPGFDTILKVIGALGLKLQATASTKRAARSVSRASRRVAKRRAA
jgi:probable addiction module antidote protein